MVRCSCFDAQEAALCQLQEHEVDTVGASGWDCSEADCFTSAGVEMS